MKKSKQPTPNGSAADGWEFNDGSRANQKFDLEERSLELASAVIDPPEKLPDSRAGISSCPNHNEAEDAESRNDFIHQLKICLKELCETLRRARLFKRWLFDVGC